MGCKARPGDWKEFWECCFTYKVNQGISREKLQTWVWGKTEEKWLGKECLQKLDWGN